MYHEVIILKFVKNMASGIVLISEKNELNLKKIKKFLIVNDLPCNSKPDIINESIFLLSELIELLDEETLNQTINLKKTI